jgi:hypothetical protein
MVKIAFLYLFFCVKFHEKLNPEQGLSTMELKKEKKKKKKSQKARKALLLSRGPPCLSFLSSFSFSFFFHLFFSLLFLGIATMVAFETTTAIASNLSF